MKKKIYSRFLSIAFLLVLTGCSALPSASTPSSEHAADSEYITVGSRLTVHNTDERLTLLSNMDTLSADGLYYASWTAGDAEPYEHADGDTVDLYDAQLYLLLGEYATAEAAEENLSGWLAAGQSNYDISAEDNVTCGEQTYTLITYDFTNEKNPYARGVSAFGVYQNCAVCMELTCRADYSEDLQEILTAFLSDCTFN